MSDENQTPDAIQVIELRSALRTTALRSCAIMLVTVPCTVIELVRLVAWLIGHVHFH